jgi:hypothetical protein
MPIFPLRDWAFAAEVSCQALQRLAWAERCAEVLRNADPLVFSSLMAELRDDGAVLVMGAMEATSLGEVERSLEGIGVTRVDYIQAE